MKKLLFLFSLVFFSLNSFTEKKLTIVSFGGAYGDAQKKHMVDPYVKKTNTRIVFESYSGGIAEIKAQVYSGNVLWDVVDIETVDLERACSEGLLEVFPFNQLPNGEDGVAANDDFFPDALSNECAVGNMYWTILYAYNEKTLINNSADKYKPSTIADFFDEKKYPGKRALRKRPQVNLEWALLADGVPVADVYTVLSTDEGQKRAFNKLDSIKNSLIWFDSWSQAPQLLNDGGAIMVQSANGRIYSAIKKDSKPFVMVWDGHVYDLDGWAIVKGSKNKESAIDFINFSTGTIPLSGMQDVAYGPTRKSASSYLSDAVKNQLPSSHLKVGLKASSDFWSDYGESLGEKFNEWLLK